MTAIDPMLPQAARIVGKTRETHDTTTIELAPAEGESFPAFSPGQFAMLYVFGVAELPISISGNPALPGGQTFTIRAVGSATRTLTEAVEGEWIGVRGPYGVGWPVEEAKGKDVMLITGGIGLAPLRPVIYHVLANRPDYGNLTLLYGARTPRDILFARQLREWGKRKDFRVLTTVDYGGMNWKGNVGVVTRLFNRVGISPKTVVMTCGPEVMMRAVAVDLREKGVKLENIYVSMERNMECAVALCGHCQFGPEFVCKDGPVFPFSRISRWMETYEL